MAHGRLAQFLPNEESFCDYKERFEFYCVANHVQPTRKKALFLTGIGGTAYGKLKDLISPHTPQDCSLEDIYRALERHYLPATVEIAERYKFFHRRQADGESVSDYVVALKRLAKTCNYGSHLESALRDQLVFGIKDKNCQKGLLCVDNLDFSTALKIAMSSEVVSKESQMMGQRTGDEFHEVSQVSGHSSSPVRCYRCGDEDHLARTCRHKSARCPHCGKIGHLAKVCQKRQIPTNSRRYYQSSNRQARQFGRAGESRGQVRAVGDESDHSDQDEVLQLKTGSINACKQPEKGKLMATLHLNDIPVDMEIDTGADVCTMSWDVFRAKFKEDILQPTSTTLRQYNGELLKIRGEAWVDVKYQGQQMKGRLIIVDVNAKIPLLGREWLYQLKMDWPTLFGERLVKQVEEDKLYEKYEKLFRNELGEVKGYEAEIYVKEGTKPRFWKCRKIPYNIRKEVDDIIDEQVRTGELTAVESSEWAAPVVVVKRGEGEAQKLRICGDFKVTINPHVIKQTYPLPTAESIFSTLVNGESFSTLDLAKAYKQMKVKAECQDLLTINTPKGLMRHNRLPFGLNIAPNIWQRTMDDILKGIPGVGCYLDDIIVTGKTREEHHRNLEQVFERLEAVGLRLKKAKCRLFQNKVLFLGHEISRSGIKPTDERIQGVVAAPEPRDKKELKSFLGMVTYNCKFLPNLSSVLCPLYDLTKRDAPWRWTEECRAAFLASKRLMTCADVLTHYDSQKPVKLYCDASGRGLGCCLVHVFPDGSEKPVAFASRVLSSAEKNYSQLDLEALAVVYGVRRFHDYVFGRRFTLVTDHKPLCKILGETEPVPTLAAARLQRWAFILSSYDYELQHIAGDMNHSADCMSRLPHGKPLHKTVVHSIDEGSPVTGARIAAETAKDSVLSRVFGYTKTGRWPTKMPPEIQAYHRRRNELSLEDGCVLLGQRVVVPGVFRKPILDELHSGHLGIVRMKSLARCHVWWPGLDKDIQDVSDGCSACKENQSTPPASPSHPWMPPDGPWERVHVDFASWRGKHFLVLVDAYSKWPETYQMQSTSAQKVAAVLRRIFSTHGYPECLVSDNGPPFTSSEFKSFVDQCGILHKLTPPYHPSSNGLAESMVKALKNFLNKENKVSDLNKSLDDFLLSFRNTPHTSTGQTPAEILFKRGPRTKLAMTKPSMKNRLKFKARAGTEPSEVRQFAKGEAAMLKDLRPGASNKWVAVTIVERHGPLIYTVEVDGRLRKAHLDHLARAANPFRG